MHTARALHDGRITTSIMASVVGLYEPASASVIGVPPSLSGHHKALAAYARLRAAPVDCECALTRSLSSHHQSFVHCHCLWRCFWLVSHAG